MLAKGSIARCLRWEYINENNTMITYHMDGFYVKKRHSMRAKAECTNEFSGVVILCCLGTSGDNLPPSSQSNISSHS